MKNQRLKLVALPLQIPPTPFFQRGGRGWAIIALTLCLALLPPTTAALTSDAEQQAYFKADNVSFNYHTGATVYTGNVVMDQGSTHLTADKVTVHKDRHGNTDKTIAEGNLAHYTTLPDQQKKPIYASGNVIEYYPQKKLAVITGNAEVIQGRNNFHGPRIVYDMVKQTVFSDPSQQGGESVIVLQPQDLPGK